MECGSAQGAGWCCRVWKSGLVALEISSNPLEAAMQGRAGEMLDGRLQDIEKVVER